MQLRKRSRDVTRECETKRSRDHRWSPENIVDIRKHNKNLDDVQGWRAFLHPISGNEKRALQVLDVVAENLSAGTENIPLYERRSLEPASPQQLQLYTTQTTPELVSAAVTAGFFVFASSIEKLPHVPLKERALTNLELGGPEPPGPEDPGGRLVLELDQPLRIGKRAMRTCAACSPDKAASPPGTFAYRLTVNQAFEEVWEQIIAQHGLDWMGFTRIRKAYHALHAMRPLTHVKEEAQSRKDSHTEEECPTSQSCPDCGFDSRQARVVSLELWDDESNTLVSGEIGCLVGRAYSCLSLFAHHAQYPRCQHVRATAAALWLRRAGVLLLDAGTTASYYSELFGYRAVPRRRFLSLWRSARSCPLPHANLLLESCADVRRLLEEGRTAQPQPTCVETETKPPQESVHVHRQAGEIGGQARAEDCARDGQGQEGKQTHGGPWHSEEQAADSGQGTGRQKHVVQVAGLPASVTEHAVREVLSGCGVLTRVSLRPSPLAHVSPVPPQARPCSGSSRQPHRVWQQGDLPVDVPVPPLAAGGPGMATDEASPAVAAAHGCGSALPVNPGPGGTMLSAFALFAEAEGAERALQLSGQEMEFGASGRAVVTVTRGPGKARDKKRKPEPRPDSNGSCQ